MAENSVLVEIRAAFDKFRSDMKDVKNEASRTANDVDKSFSSKQLKFNTTVAKANFRELTALKKNLDTQYIKAIDLKVNSESLVELRRRISLTNSELEKYKNVSNSVSNNTKSGGGAGILGLIGGLGIAAGVGVSIASFTNFLKDSVQEAREAQQVFALVEQAVKSTGASAGLSAIQLKALADKLEDIVGIDGDRILKDSILQLTSFRNISGDTFKRASELALDLSTKMDGDLKSATMAIGKALNSPKEALGALTKAGIQFTAEQKNTIENFIKLNDLASAQTYILDTLTKSVGGQAKALNDASGGVRNLGVAWGNLKETVGDSDGVLGGMIGTIAVIADKAIRAINDLVGVNVGSQLKNIAEDLEGTEYAKGKKQVLIEGAANFDKKSLEDNIKLWTNEAVRLGNKYLKENGISENFKLNLSGDTEKDLNNINQELIKYNDIVNKGKIGSDEWWTALKRIQALDLQKLQVQNPVGKNGAELSDDEKSAIENFNKQKKALADEIKLTKDLQSEKERLSQIDDARDVDDYVTIYKDKVEELSNDMVNAKDQETYDKLAAEKKYYEGAYKLALEQFDNIVDITEDELDDYKKNLNTKLQWEKDNLKEMQKIADKRAEIFRNAQQEEMEKEAEKKRRRTQDIRDILNDGNPFDEKNFGPRMAIASINSMQAGLDGFFEDAVIKSDWANSMLEKGFVSMANTFIREVQRMAIQWAILQAAKVAANFLGIPLPMGNISTVPSSAPIGVEIGAISQKYNNSSANSGANYNAVIESNNRTTNAILALNKTLIDKDMVVNIAPGMNDIDVVKQKINPAQRRVNKSRFKSR